LKVKKIEKYHNIDQDVIYIYKGRSNCWAKHN
jgi:CRISPR/Cas system-associated endoribonuclease Cas2